MYSCILRLFGTEITFGKEESLYSYSTVALTSSSYCHSDITVGDKLTCPFVSNARREPLAAYLQVTSSVHKLSPDHNAAHLSA